MNAYVLRELDALKCNVQAGSRLAFFQQSAIKDFYFGIDKVFFVIAFNLILSILVDYFLSLPDPEFNSYAISGAGLHIMGVVAVAFVLCKVKRDDTVFLPFVLQVSSTVPVYVICWTFVNTLLDSQLAYYGFLAWSIFIAGFIAYLHLDRNIVKSLIPGAGYGVLVLAPGLIIQTGDFWYESFQDDAEYEKYAGINQENLFYDQFDYLNSMYTELMPGRPGTTDLYFVGFGSYASEDVFMKEIHYIQKLMDNKYDTKGRSIALINNFKTMQDTPMATSSNLARTLDIMGQKMNKEEDILFLYLTSHGSRTPELAVSFWPLHLNPVTPQSLKVALDDSGIKWRIILVSACYSGSFLEPLKNENTLVMTAAAHDRTSFGCGTKSDFTYFGRAVFIEQLNNQHTFVPAFEQAIQSITEREKNENLKPSHPQLHIGANLKPKLSNLEFELNQYYRRN